MTELLGKLGFKLGAGAVALVAPFLFPKVREFAKDKFSGLVEKLIALGKSKLTAVLAEKLAGKDPRIMEQIRIIVMAFVRLAEILIPDDGMGVEKKKAVTAWLSTLMPPVVAELLSSMIDDCVREMNAELQKEIKEDSANLPH